jgi:YVTN family beta-propeller protein
VLTQDRVFLYALDGTLITHLTLKAGPLGLAWTPDGRTLFASADKGQVYHVAEAAQDRWTAMTSFVVDNLSDKPQADEEAKPADTGTELRPDPGAQNLLKRHQKASKLTGDPQVTGLAVSPDGKRLYIALSKRNAVTVVDIASETKIATVGVAPFRIIISPDSKTVFVANRGGRHPEKGETVGHSAGTALRVDPKTDAGLRGSISFIDAVNLTATEMDESRQPTGLSLSHDGKTLYVANAGEDTVTEVDVPAHLCGGA